MAKQRLVERVAVTVTYDDGQVETCEGPCHSITTLPRGPVAVAIGEDGPAGGPLVLDVEIEGLVVGR